MYIGDSALASRFNPLMSTDVAVRYAGITKKELTSEQELRSALPRDYSYVSWWPKSNKGGKVGVMFLKQQSQALADLAEDIYQEGGRPHVHYKIYGLSKTLMLLKWRDMVLKYEHEDNRYTSYKFGSKNCAAVVWRVLCAGGIEGLLANNMKGYWQAHSGIWTPKKVAIACNTLSDTGLCEKEKSFMCPSKKSLILDCMFGLR